MTKTRLVESEIERFLADAHPGVISVSGEWGVGKTYTWQTILDRSIATQQIALGRYSYVSLFGLNSLEALRNAIFENSEFLLPDESTTVSKGKKMGNEVLTLIQKGRSIASAIPQIGKLVEQSGALLFSAVRNQIVCIDDLERRGANLSIRDVLGLISFLKEQRSCKIVLLLNEGELGDSKDEYRANLEKTVDIELRFAPTPEDCVRIALPSAERASTQIAKGCVELGVKNIRVVKKIERLVRSALPFVQEFGEPVQDRLIRTITVLSWMRLQPRIAPPMSYALNKKGPRLWGLGKDKKEEVSAEEVAWESALEKYGFRMDELSSEILKGIESGYFDPDRIRAEAKIIEETLGSNQKLASFNAAWKVYHDSFGADEDEFKTALYNSSKDAIDQIGVSGLNSAVTMLKELGEVDKAREIIHLYISNANPTKEDWKLQDHLFDKDISDPEVRDAFAAQAEKLRDSVSFIDALYKLAERNGWNDDDLAALSGATVKDYIDAFKSAPRDSLSSLVNAVLQFGKVSNASQEMKGAFHLAKDALIAIGSESKLNARRVAKYGIHL